METYRYRIWKNEYNRNFLLWLTSKFEVIEITIKSVTIICNVSTINIIQSMMFIDNEILIESAKYNIIVNNPQI